MELTTILLSLRVGIIATLLNIPLALLISLLIVRSRFQGKYIVDGIVNLPLVMPPVTTGYLLLYLLGRNGPLGSVIYNLFHIPIAFTLSAAVIASMIVSFPLIVRNISASLEMVDSRLEQAARTLGAGRFEVFRRVTLPLILPGVITGTIIGFARCLGEFGATITFAGNITGETRTIPLAVYSLLQVPGKEKEAGLLVLVSIGISFGAMLFSTLFNKMTKRKKGVHHES